MHIWFDVHVAMVTLMSHTVILLTSPPDTSILPRKLRHLTNPICPIKMWKHVPAGCVCVCVFH